MKNNLTNTTVFAYPDRTISTSGLSAPVSSGFFVPGIRVSTLLWRVDRAEYNTRKGNTPGRLVAVVESRRSHPAKPLTNKEAQNE